MSAVAAADVAPTTSETLDIGAVPDAATAAMERGESGAGREGGQDVELESSHVVVAAAESYVEERRNIISSTSRGYRCMAKACNVMLIGLVLGFAVIFAYAWIDAFRKSHYDHAIGLITVMFIGTVICSLGYRRRLAAIERLEQDNELQMQIDQIDFVEQYIQPPKGVPPHVRQTFDYFIFSTPANTVAARKLSTKATTPSCQGSTTGLDRQASFASSMSAADSTFKEITAQAKDIFASTSFDENKADSMVGGGTAFPRQQAQRMQQAQHQHQRQHQHHHHHGIFAWASSTLTDCSVCLEAYRTGDRVCRLPCMHAFHAVCIDTWLDQQHVCPQCRLDLLPADFSWGRSSRSSAVSAVPFSTLFGPVDRMRTMSRPSASSDNRTSDASPAAATAGMPMRSFSYSPAYGASPTSAVGGMFHFRRSRHGTYSTSGSPATTTRTHLSHLISPAYTPSPLSTATSSNLRWSPHFVSVGTRSRGTPVPTGRFGMFPSIVPRSSSFPTPDPSHQRNVVENGSGWRSRNVGGGGVGGARRHLPPTPSRGRGLSTHSATPSASHQPQQTCNRHLQGDVHLHQAQGKPSTVATVAAPSPPPLLRLTPRSQAQVFLTGERPPTPLSTVSPRLSTATAAADVARGRENPDGNASGLQENAGSGDSGDGAAVGGSGGGDGGTARGGGRARSNSGHKRFLLPNLTRRLRSRSCDVVGYGSPRLFFLGNASPKSARGTTRDADWLGGTILSNKGRSSTRPRVRVASWEETDNLSRNRARCRPESDDFGLDGDWGQRGALGLAFMSGSSCNTGQQGSPIGGASTAGNGVALNIAPNNEVQGEQEQQVQHQSDSPEERQQALLPNQRHLIQYAASHAHLSFDDDTSEESEIGGVEELAEVGDEDLDEEGSEEEESEIGGVEELAEVGDEDLDEEGSEEEESEIGGVEELAEVGDEDLDEEGSEEEEVIEVEGTIGRLRGQGNFWNMLACQ